MIMMPREPKGCSAWFVAVVCYLGSMLVHLLKKVPFYVRRNLPAGHVFLQESESEHLWRPVISFGLRAELALVCHTLQN